MYKAQGLPYRRFMEITIAPHIQPIQLTSLLWLPTMAKNMVTIQVDVTMI
jgi:hypothetical protein